MKWLLIWLRIGLEEYFQFKVLIVDKDYWDIIEFMLMIYVNVIFQLKEI